MQFCIAINITILTCYLFAFFFLDHPQSVLFLDGRMTLKSRAKCKLRKNVLGCINSSSTLYTLLNLIRLVKIVNPFFYMYFIFYFFYYFFFLLMPASLLNFIFCISYRLCMLLLNLSFIKTNILIK